MLFWYVIYELIILVQFYVNFPRLFANFPNPDPQRWFLNLSLKPTFLNKEPASNILHQLVEVQSAILI